MKNHKGLARKNFMQNFGGFTLIEGLLILVIAGLLGGTGWYVWRVHNKTANSFTNAGSSNNSAAKNSKNPAADTAKPSSSSSTPSSSKTPTKSTGSSTPTPAPATETVISTTDGKVQFTLLADWEISERVDNKDGICLDNKPVSIQGTCLMSARIKPKDFVTYTQWPWFVKISKVTSDKKWSNDYPSYCDKESAINSYDTYNCLTGAAAGHNTILTPDNVYVIEFGGDNVRVSATSDKIDQMIQTVKFNN